MLKKFILISCFTLLLSLGASAQKTDTKSKSFFQVGLMYLTQLGDVHEKGSDKLFYSSLYPGSPQDQAAQTNHMGNHLGASFVYGKFLSSSLQLGVGVNTEMYLNIGDNTLFTLPVYVLAKYNIPTKKNAFFVSGELGYAPISGGDFHGGLKSGLGLGYEIVSSKTDNRYSIGFGYNYQMLDNVKQNVFSTTTGQGGSRTNTLQTVNKVKLNLNTLPITFKYTF